MNTPWNGDIKNWRQAHKYLKIFTYKSVRLTNLDEKEMRDFIMLHEHLLEALWVFFNSKQVQKRLARSSQKVKLRHD